MGIKYGHGDWTEWKNGVRSRPVKMGSMTVRHQYQFKDMVEKMDKPKPTETQVGGAHYKGLAIQPMEYALKNNLNYAQANVVKYITRYKDKGGVEDLRKAIHNVELLIEHEGWL